MSLARSVSGPGGLTINTGAANSLGGTSSTQPAPAGGLFGSTTTSSTAQASQPTQSGGLFGASASKPASGGLFGSSSTAASTTTTAPQAGGLFASATTASQPQQQQQNSGIFGSNTASSTAAKPATGGLFGSTASTTTQQPQQQSTSGALFSSSTMNQGTQSTGGGLFGNTTNTQQQQPNSSLFGAKPAQPTATSGGLFGASTQQNAASAQKAGGLFGSSLSQPAQQQQPTLGLGQSLGSGLTMGQSSSGSATGQVVPGVRIDISQLRGTTRFNDLQEDLQKQIMAIDMGIQRAMSQKNELDAFLPAHGEQVEAIPGDVRFVERKYEGIDNALGADARAIKTVKDMIAEDAENARLSFRAIDNLKLPSAYHTQSLWRAGAGTQNNQGDTDADTQHDLVGFFSRVADEMDTQLQKYKSNLGEIEGHMYGVNAGIHEQLQRIAASRSNSSGVDSLSNRPEDRLAELAAVLRDFEESILQVAGKVSDTREGVTRLQLGEFLSLGNGLS